MSESAFAFENYLALLAYIRDSESSDESRPNSGFRDSCKNYFDSVTSTAKKLSGGNGSQFRPELYDPVQWLAFGRTDHLGLVLLDDFDPVFEITSELDASIERISLAFCPKIDSLGLGELLDAEERKYLRSLHHVLGRSSEERNTPKAHAFETATPLVALGRMKLGVLAATAQGLLILRAVFRSLAVRAINVIRELKKDDPRCTMLQIRQEDLLPENLWFSLLNPQGFDEIGVIIGCRNYSVASAIIAGFRSLTMAHVYAEGDEQLATTFLKEGVSDKKSEIFKRQQETQGEKHGRNAPNYLQELVKSNDLANNSAPREYKAGLPRNHLFMSSYTTLGVSEDYFWGLSKDDAAQERCSGLSHVNTQLQVHPGHENVIASQLGRSNTPEDIKGLEPLMLADDESISVFEMGQNDFSFTLGTKKWNEILQPRGVPIGEVIRTARAYYKDMLPVLKAIQNGESGLRNSTFILTIPFPRLRFHEVPHFDVAITPAGSDAVALNEGHSREYPIDARHHAYFREHLSVVSALNELRKRAKKKFDVVVMMRCLRDAGIPRHLRFAMRYLFQDFFLHLSNAATMAGVLDLYDAFATLYHINCQVLPARAKKEASDGRDLNVLKEVVDALHNALTHRVTTNHGFLEAHDTAIDWRGGLNQLTEAADVPLKTAIGLVKLRALANGRIKEENRFERVASITAVKLTPQAQCSSALFTSATDAPVLPKQSVERRRREPASDRVSSIHAKDWHCLSYLHVNVGHVFHPLMYIAYLHEGAHLIPEAGSEHRQELLAHLQGMKDRANRLNLADLLVHAELVKSRHDEQFANSIVFQFVFAGNKELFLRYAFSQFGVYLSPYDKNELTQGKLVEYAIRLFFAVDPHLHWNEWRQDFAETPDCGGAKVAYSQHGYEQRFLEMFDVYVPFFRHDTTPFRSKEFLELASRLFGYALAECGKFAVHEAIHSAKVYREFSAESEAAPWNAAVQSGEVPWSEEHGAAVWEPLRASRTELRDGCIAKNLKQGRVMVANGVRQYLQPATDANANADANEDADAKAKEVPVGELPLVCDMLHAYAQLTFGELDPHKRLFVPRDGKRRQISELKDEKCNPFMFDPGLDRFFCPDPIKRGEHLTWQIVILKKLWDLSSTMRGRRLLRLATHGPKE